MAKHTPGPWMIDGDFIVSKTKMIAQVMHPIGIKSATALGSYPSKPFNAKLLAAAPEMLAFLKRIIGHNVDADLHNEAVRLIAKAGGDNGQS